MTPHNDSIWFWLSLIIAVAVAVAIILVATGVFGLALVRFTGPSGQPIDINPETIVSVRVPQAEALKTEHFAPGTHCLLFTVDGKPIPVQEDCGIARLKLGGKQ